MRNNSTKLSGTNENKDKNTTAKRINRLRKSARTLQLQIDTITKEIQELELELGHEKRETSQGENTEGENLRVGQRIIYNRKAGKPLNPTHAHNPRGTIISISEQWIHFRTDDGDIKYRAPKNIASIK